jgi:enoyl-CoA hydratase/carnithine racemase
METLNITDEGAVRIVELDRPDALNALNGQMTDDLTEAFLAAAADDAVKTLLLTGAGKAFWAGADLKEMGSRSHQPKYTFGEMIAAIIDFPKPFLIAVNGVGVGIGATICGLADAVYMSDKARLRCPFSTLGLTAEAASTVTFPRLMGHQRASWFLLSAQWMNADEVCQAGLALEVLPHEDLLPHALAQAQILAALPLASLEKTKALMVDPIRQQLKTSMRAENQGLAELQGGPANREALAAFREKREPNFG